MSGRRDATRTVGRRVFEVPRTLRKRLRAGRKRLRSMRRSRAQPAIKSASTNLMHARRDLASFSVEARLARIAKGDQPIAVGPFLYEAGSELLYWIPMLRWFAQKYEVEPRRMVAISRCGAGIWYEGLCDSYVDVLDLYPLEEVREWHRPLMIEGKGRTFKTFDARARDILEAAGLREHALLPATLFIDAFGSHITYGGQVRPPRLGDRRGRVLRRSVFKPLPPVPPLPGLPPEYVAVKAYANAHMDDSSANRRRVGTLLSRLSETTDIVLLGASHISTDDGHPDLGIAGNGRIHSVEHLMTPRNNLEVQSRVVAGASALLATFGGFSYLGPALGVRTITFYADDKPPTPTRLDHSVRFAQDLRRSTRANFSAIALGDLSVLDGALQPTAQSAVG